MCVYYIILYICSLYSFKASNSLVSHLHPGSRREEEEEEKEEEKEKEEEEEEEEKEEEKRRLGERKTCSMMRFILSQRVVKRKREIAEEDKEKEEEEGQERTAKTELRFDIYIIPV